MRRVQPILIVEAIARLRVSSIVLDGEAMCFDPEGGHDFDALWNRADDHHARLCAFELLELNGEDYRKSRCSSARSGSPGYSRRPVRASTMWST